MRKRYGWEIGGLALGTGLTFMLSEVYPSLYWPGVILVYLGLSSLVIHIAMDSAFKSKHIVIQKLAGVCVLLAIYLWSTQIVFVNAPLKAIGYADVGNYPDGMDVYGIKWDAAHFVDLRVEMDNPTDYDYGNIDLLIYTNLSIVYATQTNKPVVATFSPQLKMPETWLEGEDSSGHPMSIPVIPSGNFQLSPIYRMQCDKLPRHTTIRALLVLVSPNPVVNGHLPDHLFGPKRLPNWLVLKGQYKAVARVRDANITQEFPGFKQLSLSESLLQIVRSNELAAWYPGIPKLNATFDLSLCATGCSARD